MNLTDNELYHLLKFMAHDSLFTNKNVPKTSEKKAYRVVLCILFMNLAIGLVVILTTPEKRTHLFLKMPVYAQIWIIETTIILISIFAFAVSNDKISTPPLPSVTIQDPLEILLYYQHPDSDVFTYTEYKPICDHLDKEYEFIRYCTDNKFFNEIKDMINARSKLLILCDSFKGDVPKYADQDKSIEARNEYIDELSKLDHDLLNLLKPIVQKNIFILVKKGKLKYLPQHLQNELANKKLNGILETVRN